MTPGRHKGDGGMTSAPVCGDVSKASAVVCALGDADELSSNLGLLAATLPESCSGIAAMLEHVQRSLFEVGNRISGAGARGVNEARAKEADALSTSRLESWMAELESELAPLSRFVLPGGHPAACQAHVCRTVCRRAERSVVALAESDAPRNAVLAPAIAYLNRLSLFLFAVARVVNARERIGDTHI